MFVFTVLGGVVLASCIISRHVCVFDDHFHISGSCTEMVVKLKNKRSSTTLLVIRYLEHSLKREMDRVYPDGKRSILPKFHDSTLFAWQVTYMYSIDIILYEWHFEVFLAHLVPHTSLLVIYMYTVPWWEHVLVCTLFNVPAGLSDTQWKG